MRSRVTRLFRAFTVNLYDKDDGFKKFTLDEANALLPEIIAVTDKTVQLLQFVKNEFEVNDEKIHILESWTGEIISFGVYPKGYFTVDFKSPIPDTLFCWTYGEQKIMHTHKIYETYKNRVPIKDKPIAGFENELN